MIRLNIPSPPVWGAQVVPAIPAVVATRLLVRRGLPHHLNGDLLLMSASIKPWIRVVGSPAI